MQASFLRARTATTALISVALIVGVGATSSVVLAQSPDASLGNIVGNQGIITQGQKGNNYLTYSLEGVSGELDFKPDIGEPCPSHQPLGVIAGQNLFVFSTQTFAPIIIGDNPALVFERDADGLRLKTLSVTDSHNVVLAFLDDSKISYIRGARRPIQTASTLKLYGLDGSEILSIAYRNNCQMIISGTFGIDGNTFTISQDKITARNWIISGDFYEDESMRFTPQGVKLGRYSQP